MAKNHVSQEELKRWSRSYPLREKGSPEDGVIARLVADLRAARKKAEDKADYELFECFAGTDHFFVAAPDFMTGMAAVFSRYKAKTLDEMPKPFEYNRYKDHDATETPVIVVLR